MQRLDRTAHDLPGLPVTAVAATIVLWGLVSPLVKSASLSGPALSFYRLWIGVAALAFAMRGGASPSRARRSGGVSLRASCSVRT